MNCQELHQNIANLKSKLAAFDIGLNTLNESGQGYAVVRKEINEATIARDTILENYLQDFADKNPELFRDGYEFSEEIEGFDGEINTSTLLPNGDVFIGGDNTGIIHYSHSTREYKFSEYMWVNGDTRTSTLLPNGDVFIGGDYAQFLHYDQTTDKYAFSKDLPDYLTNICNSTLLPNGDIFVGKENGIIILRYDQSTKDYKFAGRFKRFDSATSTPLQNEDVFFGGSEARILHRDQETGEWKFSEEIEGFDNHITTSTLLQNGDVLVGGDHGEIRILHHNQETGEWKFSDPIKGFSSAIGTLTRLDNGDVMAGGDDGEIRILHYDQESEEWKFSEKIKGFNGNIKTSTLLPNGDILVGGGYYDDWDEEWHNEIRILKKPLGKTLDHLKQVLPEIAAKGGSL